MSNDEDDDDDDCRLGGLPRPFAMVRTGLYCREVAGVAVIVVVVNFGCRCCLRENLVERVEAFRRHFSTCVSLSLTYHPQAQLHYYCYCLLGG